MVAGGVNPTNSNNLVTRSKRSRELPMPCTNKGSAIVSKMVLRGFIDS